MDAERARARARVKRRALTVLGRRFKGDRDRLITEAPADVSDRRQWAAWRLTFHHPREWREVYASCWQAEPAFAGEAAPYAGTRWPFDCLLERSRCVSLELLYQWFENVGITERQVRGWHERGWLTDVEADRAAVGLGLVPALVWPDWYEAVLTDADRAEVAFHWLRHPAVVPPVERVS